MKQRRYGQMIRAKTEGFKLTGAHQHSLGLGNLLMLFLSVRLAYLEMCSSERIFFNQNSMRLKCPILKVVKPKHPYKVR